ncbi:nitroreductase [Deinococcus sp. HSC-46F16]|uniref:nitroreductase family protein n=1 Tax=Deinococcus sp. HSC-46F16 TaxID=2910968 RepID=UPI00209D820C|nr:nitroreductase family protein [Deinococcus sp. HSC-46F16]MCP2013313.1 nitroreductase [Deinococcus sp. HSC-46F16]
MQTVPEALAGHRSIRKYRPDPIPQAIIDEVLHEAITGTSSSGNLNSYSLVLTRDPGRKRRLYELHGEQEFVLQAPLVVTFCADWHRTRTWLRRRGARDNFGNLLGYHVGAFDAVLLSQSVSLGFEARGYGICYMGTTLNAMREIAEFLSLPESCVPVTSLVVGVPDEAPGKRDRLPLRAFVHDETYRVPDAAELDDLYLEREVRGWERYMADPRLRAKAEEGGITSLAQFYTSPYKYDPDRHAADSARIAAFLAEHGFLPEGTR